MYKKIRCVCYALLALCIAESLTWRVAGSNTDVQHPGSKQQQTSGVHRGIGRRLSSSKRAAARPSSYNIAMGCEAPRISNTEPSGVPIPPLKEGQRPNFIVILTDDQGWDDIGLHNPNYVNTPNLDKFLRKGTKFDNFYVTPHCSGTRASLLTGRSYPRTGVMLVHGGYDYIHTNETTAAMLFKRRGYSTAHFGKWHNANVPGYEPEQVGFEESWYAPGFGEDVLRRNGVYLQAGSTIQTGSYSREDILMDELLGYLQKQEYSDKPFFVYYAPHAIHFTVTGQSGLNLNGPALFMPSGYKDRYLKEARYKGISDYTLSAWAMLEYLDTVLGRLFKYLDSSPHKQKTYIMISGDNGPDMRMEEILHGKELRMPSLMQGEKHEVLEGGTRTFLAVQGPGVQAGVVDSTLTDITDILPTIADLAGFGPRTRDHMPWDGLSLKNLLVPPKDATMLEKFDTTGRRFRSLATEKQLERFVFSLNMHCWDSNAVPRLAGPRDIARPQQLIDYERGGDLAPYLKHTYTGFQPCIGVRYRKFKWVGMTGKVYSFERGSHVELPCNEVTGGDGERLARIMSEAARNWWQSIVAEPHSFSKPTFFLGLESRMVTNIVAEGSYDRTDENIKLLRNGAKGFKRSGDKMCWRVQIAQASRYDVIIMYTSQQQAIFRFTIGPQSALLSSRAESLVSQLPPQRVLEGRLMGTVHLQASRPTERPDACLELVRRDPSAAGGDPVFSFFGTLRIIRRRDKHLAALPVVSGSDVQAGAAVVRSAANAPNTALVASAVDALDSTSATATAQYAADDLESDLTADENDIALTLNTAGRYHFLNTPLEVSEQQQQLTGSQQPQGAAEPLSPAVLSIQSSDPATRSAAALDASGAPIKAARRSSHSMTPEQWRQVRMKYKWPAGQGVLEDMWSPYDAEDIGDCNECHPDLE